MLKHRSDTDRFALTFKGLTILLYLFLVSCSGGGASSTETSTELCALAGTRPWIVSGTRCSEDSSSVLRLTVSGLTQQGVCTATLLSSTKALTAAHCLTTFPVARAEVNVNGSAIQVARIFIHPQAQRQPPYYRNDIAIIELTSPAAIQPAALLISHAMNSGDPISVFGYGLSDSEATQEISEGLRGGPMRIAEVDGEWLSARYDDGNSNPCFGDSGGPVFYRGSTEQGGASGIVGVISSASSPSCAPGETNLFANVQAEGILDFILEQVPEVAVR